MSEHDKETLIFTLWPLGAFVIVQVFSWLHTEAGNIVWLIPATLFGWYVWWVWRSNTNE